MKNDIDNNTTFEVMEVVGDKSTVASAKNILMEDHFTSAFYLLQLKRKQSNYGM